MASAPADKRASEKRDTRGLVGTQERAEQESARGLVGAAVWVEREGAASDTAMQM